MIEKSAARSPAPKFLDSCRILPLCGRSRCCNCSHLLPEQRGIDVRGWPQQFTGPITVKGVAIPVCAFTTADFFE